MWLYPCPCPPVPVEPHSAPFCSSATTQSPASSPRCSSSNPGNGSSKPCIPHHVAATSIDTAHCASQQTAILFANYIHQVVNSCLPRRNQAEWVLCTRPGTVKTIISSHTGCMSSRAANHMPHQPASDSSCLTSGVDCTIKLASYKFPISTE